MVDKEKVLELHKKHRGKMEIFGKVPLITQEDLSNYYTPGVAYASLAIKEDRSKVYDYTMKSNTIAIVTDGTRILGLGDIGSEAGLPVMEGKAILFKKFGGVDAIPICLKTKDEAEIIKLIENISPTFGAINIEDIASPKSFHIVDKLSDVLDIPVFHDDQQGTATVVLAALFNSLKLAEKKLANVKIVVNGSGSAGVGIVRLLHAAGAKRIYVVDTHGLIYEGRNTGMNEIKGEIAKLTNPEKLKGDLASITENADVLIGVSVKGAFSRELIQKMASKPIVFALANPEPEMSYSDAKAAGAFIVATGRSDTPNQVNNLLAFPSIMRGLLDSRARKLNQEILISAAKAMAKGVGKNLTQEHIVPALHNQKLLVKTSGLVAAAVVEAANRMGVARVHANPREVNQNTKALIRRYIKIEKKIVSKD